MKLPVWIVAIGLAACQGTPTATDAAKKSGLGESCAKTDDCTGDLHCLAAVCQTADASVGTDVATGPDTDATGNDASSDVIQPVDTDTATEHDVDTTSDTGPADVAVPLDTDTADIASPPADSQDASDAGAQTSDSVDVPDACSPICDGKSCTNNCGGTCDGQACDDGNVCTKNDVCTGASCKGTPNPCDDANPCTDDACVAPSGCTHTPNSAACDDGSACTSGDLCSGGKCSGSSIICDDGNDCTADACDKINGCTYISKDGVACSDGNECTKPDTCQAKACKAGTQISCDDTNACTTDTCNPSGGCQHAAQAGSCTGGGTCVNGACCIPNCDGTKCGSDGCGGSCACGDGYACIGSKCTSACDFTGYHGCCDGNKNIYCLSGTPSTQDCSSTSELCGWSQPSTGNYYACGTGSGADPAGTYPMQCTGVALCVPKDHTGCCGGGLCWFDSCGVQGDKLTDCAWGCSVATQACYTDPCQGVSADGICVPGNGAVQRCSVPTGNGTPQLVMQPCDSFQSCTVVAGYADCTAKSGLCTPSTTKCSTVADKVDACDATAKVQVLDCKGCKDTAIGAACLGSVATKLMTGTFKYEAKGMNAAKTGWDPTVTQVTLANATVAVVHKNAAGAMQLIDAGETDSNGAFQLQVPVAPDPADEIILLLGRADPLTQTLSFAVAKPDVADGKVSVSQPPPATSVVWSWTIPSGSWQEGATWPITLGLSSGAARIFDYMRYVYSQTAALNTTPGKSVVAWVRYGTTWSCGSCFLNDTPAKVGNQDFQTEIFYSGSTQDEEFWADAVTAHELGHWVMASWGHPPGEGGAHYVGGKSHPGLAWSEGWATGFSSLARSSGLYFDSAGGSTFWIDLGIQQYSPGEPSWNPLSATGGLLQMMDENEIAAEIWELANQTAPPLKQTGNHVFFDALKSQRMTVPPFARGYTKMAPTFDATGNVTGYVDTKISAPMLADFLDALLCQPGTSITPGAIDLQVSPYPYPSSSPICN